MFPLVDFWVMTSLADHIVSKMELNNTREAIK